MKLAVRALTLWVILGVLTWQYATTDRGGLELPLAFGSVHLHPAPGSWLSLAAVIALIPAFGAWLTISAVTVLPKRWPWRLAFWMVTVPVWAALLVMMQGRAEAHPDERLILACAAGLAGLAAVLLPLKMRPFPVWCVLREIALVAALFAAAAGVFLGYYDAGTRAIARRAEARWTEIGLPLAEFEKTLVASQENAGSAVVREVLREQVSSRFYKDGTRAADREPAIERPEAITQRLRKASLIVTTELPPSDDVDLSKRPVAAIESLGPSLDADYRRILAAEPAAWASDPHDGYFINVPNFVGIRTFAQLAAADAMRRFAVGDQAGAARALSAGRRLSTGLRQNPTLVSLMVNVSVEGLIASKEAYLPPSADGLPAIARDLADLRAEFLKRLQLEGWLCLRFADEISLQAMDHDFPAGPFPKWLGRIESRTWTRRAFIIAALNGAEHAAIQKDPATMLLSDLGVSRHEAVSEAFPTPMEFNACRAAMRIYAVLLLREQSELIRIARVRLAEGKPAQSHDSAVVPGARWELATDADRSAVSTRLVGAPEWIIKQEVTRGDFWCLPIDGSVAWQFHRPTHTARGY